MSRQAVEILSLAVVLQQDTPAHRYVSASGLIGGKFGVTKTAGKAGETVNVTVLGTAIVETGGSFGAGFAITTDGTGRAFNDGSGSSDRAIGLEGSRSAGNFVEVLLLPQPQPQLQS